MPLCTEVGPRFTRHCVRWGPSSQGGAGSPIFGQCPLWPNGWMDSDATWYGDRPRPRRLCDPWGPSYPQKKLHTPTKFLAHVYCGQTAGWIKMPLGTEVNLYPGDIVLDGVAAPPKRGTAPPVISSCLLWPNGWMGTAPSYRFMSVVAKWLDGRRHYLVRK